MIIKRQIPGPRSEGSPYIPVITYTTAWPMVIIMPNTSRKEHLISALFIIALSRTLNFSKPHIS